MILNEKNAFETYVKTEMGDIAIFDEGKYISPKIQNYWKIWKHVGGIKLQGEIGVLINLLKESLQVIETLEGDNTEENERLLELRKKITGAIQSKTPEKAKCWCHSCNRDVLVNGIPFSLSRMILCPDCGNKRCPKANNHTFACTNSNEPNQVGSAYNFCPK